MSFCIKIWGSRGSLPSPLTPRELEERIAHAAEAVWKSRPKSKSELRQALESLPRASLGGFGGNTPCIEVSAGKTQLIIDGGSGIRALGEAMSHGPAGKGKADIHLLMTHFHWDHLMGLPFFYPLFVKGNTVHVYAVQKDLPAVFHGLFKKPFFPVPLEKLGATLVFHTLAPRKPIRIGEARVTPYQLDHPDPCWGFRIQHGKKVYSHCVDTEANRTSRKQLGPDLPLYQGVDLMVFDAQYSLLEVLEKVDWGHASASVGLDIAMREGIKRVLFMHHDPAAPDQKIAAAEAQAKRYYQDRLKAQKRNGETLFTVDWSYAFEGIEVVV